MVLYSKGKEENERSPLVTQPIRHGSPRGIVRFGLRSFNCFIGGPLGADAD